MAITSYTDFVNNYLTKNGMIGNAANINKAPDQLKLEVDELNQSIGTLGDTAVKLTGNQTIAGVKTFSSTISGSINGNAATATTLQTARTISGVSFNGSTNIEIEDRLGTAIASAATITVGTRGLGDYIHITGTTTITSLGTAAAAGIRRTLIFDGVLTLTHNATSLICPGAANIVTVAGTVIEVIAETTANWRVVSVTHPSLSMAELGYLDGVTSSIQTQINAKAPLASPALTGTPTAPTAAVGTSTTQLATTQFVNTTNIGNGTTSFNGFGGSGFKNYIINGNFNIDQYKRGAQSNWSSPHYCYTDRFLVVNSSNVERNGAGENNNPTGFTNHLSVYKTAGADTQIIQRLEIPKDNAKVFLNGRTLTFSCWVLSDVSNFIEDMFFIKQGTTVNANEVKVFSITKNSTANIWTRITGTISNIQWTYEAGDCIEIRIDPSEGTAGTIHITGWQLEEGSVATPFEQRPIGLELSLCQRYYRVGTGVVQKHSDSGNHMGTQPINFNYSMLVPPTISFSKSGTKIGDKAIAFSASATELSVWGGVDYADSAIGEFTVFMFNASAEL